MERAARWWWWSTVGTCGSVVGAHWSGICGGGAEPVGAADLGSGAA
jgi:hypothetical protein